MTEPSNQIDEAARLRGIRNTVIILLVIVASIIAYMMIRASMAPVLNQEELRERGAVVFDQPRRFSDLELVDHKGEAFTRERLEGRWSLLFFGFTHCPDICPMTMADLGRLVGDLPEEVAANTQVALVTLDPARDTPDQLSEYVNYFHPEFVGVTGEFLDLRRFANEVNVAFSKVTLGDDDYTVDHSSNIVIINPKGDYHGFFRPPFEHDRLKSTYLSIYRAFRY